MTDTNDSRDNLRFADRVDPDSTVTLTHDIEEPLTIEQLTVRIYRGAELDLHVLPFVEQGGEDGHRVPLVTFRGKEYIDGDGDKWDFGVIEEARPGDRIGVEVVNKSTEYGYDFSADFSLERAGGLNRLAAVVGGWF